MKRHQKPPSNDTVTQDIPPQKWSRRSETPTPYDFKKPKLQKYAPKKYGAKQHDFQSTWYSGRPWLEFSVALEAAFCYCCRHFSNRIDPHFTVTGFSNWQHGLEKNKGFSKHAASIVHMQAMAAWKEKEIRASTKQEISTLVNERQLEQNRYYITSIVEAIQFLCTNELPLRGDGHSSIKTLDADNQDEPSGLFLRLFEYTLSKDVKLKEIFNTVPKNACYTSAMVQNEIISILKEVVLKDVVSDVNGSDIPYFTVKADGTRDPTNTENISVVVRFVKQGKVHEVLIDMTTSVKLDVDALMTAILKSLERCGLNPMNLLSQCYDRASVMAGKNGRVQKGSTSVLESKFQTCIASIISCTWLWFMPSVTTRKLRSFLLPAICCIILSDDQQRMQHMKASN